MFRPFRPRRYEHPNPRPPLALLASTQALTLRAFSPDYFKSLLRRLLFRASRSIPNYSRASDIFLHRFWVAEIGKRAGASHRRLEGVGDGDIGFRSADKFYRGDLSLERFCIELAGSGQVRLQIRDRTIDADLLRSGGFKPQVRTSNLAALENIAASQSHVGQGCAGENDRDAFGRRQVLL
jgi:hypothetical protein